MSGTGVHTWLTYKQMPYEFDRTECNIHQ